MPRVDRRSFIRLTGTASVGAAAVSSLPGVVAGAEFGSTVATGETALPPGTATPAVTARLAQYIVGARYEDLPAPVRKEGVRTFFNYVGGAVGGSSEETVDIAVTALAPFSGPPQAGLLGRRERFDIMNAAFVNGVSSHVHDYDDTHLKTIIHPGSPVISAAMAAAEYRPTSGKDLLNALVVGIEVALRLGNSVYPNHYDRGWHITGTCGVFGAAAAAGKLLALSQRQMIWALGLAASTPVGLRESFGSMNKSFNPGKAAGDGIFAALLAARNFTSSDGMIEARRGWANTISTKQDYSEVTDELGIRFESALNTYKPFACGIVLHPALDAAIQLRNANGLKADQISRIELRVHPLVLELTGKKTPTTGLEGKFSVYHAVAVALLDGMAGPKQFSDRIVQEPAVLALRTRVFATVDPALRAEQADMTIVLDDGRQLHKFIEHAVGSVDVPMSDQALEAKFADLADGVLPQAQTRRLMQACWNLEELADAADVVRLAGRTL
jgi:2-methylcitrate dehydratase PrpD